MKPKQVKLMAIIGGSALITLGIASGTAANPGGASYMMDHIQVGPLEEIFKDDFEPN